MIRKLCFLGVEFKQGEFFDPENNRKIDYNNANVKVISRNDDGTFNTDSIKIKRSLFDEVFGDNYINNVGFLYEPVYDINFSTGTVKLIGFNKTSDFINLSILPCQKQKI